MYLYVLAFKTIKIPHNIQTFANVRKDGHKKNKLIIDYLLMN